MELRPEARWATKGRWLTLGVTSTLEDYWQRSAPQVEDSRIEPVQTHSRSSRIDSVAKFISAVLSSLRRPLVARHALPLFLYDTPLFPHTGWLTGPNPSEEMAPPLPPCTT